jgi:hypothetical protein
MRRLRILVERSRGALPVVAVAVVVPVTSCSDDDERTRTTSQAGTGGLASDAAGGARAAGGSGGSAGVISVGGIGGISPDGEARPDSGCGGASSGYTYVVDLPPPGVPAEPGQICAISTEPVASNRTARVTLTATATGPQIVDGRIAIDPMLTGQVLGEPVVSVVEATLPELMQLQVSGITRQPDGFSFQGSWPTPLDLYRTARLTIKVAFDIACDADARDVRRVEALTNVHGCRDAFEFEWISSGDECRVCTIVAEMAPSPIVPDKAPDGLPLARAIRLRLIELARVGNTVVLLAENDGGDGVEYEWQAASGVLERLAPDVVAWTSDDAGPHHVQAAVFGKSGAAVASFSRELLS